MGADENDRSKANGSDGPSFAGGPLRESSWLLPSNRKLRHLQGISLRNLTLSTEVTRPRGKTIDDESLPQTWKSPAKLLAQREERELGHSKSSSDLSGNARKASMQFGRLEGQLGPKPLERPSISKGRRRSTLTWPQGTFASGHRTLEDVVGERMADTWFSIHCESQEGPIYVSEIVPKAMNPNFRFFDLQEYGPAVTRLDTMRIKFWAKSARMQDYELLLDITQHLRGLQFIGKSLENFHHPLPPNCVIFYLPDGLYANLTAFAPYELPLLSFKPPKSPVIGESQPTSSYDALMRLSTLDDCIQDALATRSSLAAQIDSLIKINKSALDLAPEALDARERVASTRRALAAERKQLKAAVKTRADLRVSLEARRAAMRQGRRAQERARDYLEDATIKLTKCRSVLANNKQGIRGQQRRIVEDLMRIHPIEPIPSRPLHFTIGSLPLPNSSFSDPSATSSNEDTISAALGYVAHIIYLLSFYLSVPLPYPLQSHSSTSTIHDPISLLPNAGHTSSIAPAALSSSQAASNTTILSPSRIFPLYPGRSTVPYRFEYGVFLLNKDLERLMATKGLKALDLRQTLPNLKYLLEVMRGDESGVVPERKRGGIIRGLSAWGSREGSELLTPDEDGQGSEAVSPSASDTATAPPIMRNKKSGNAAMGQSDGSAETKPGGFSARAPSHDSLSEPGDKARELVERDAEGLLGRLKRQAIS
ncbi:MAG: hypothetical protein M4579_006631 [Chaenotheca gracillima]|nr:MAG: hypothetical protein M4579_006631 [Chaenotheca gracillima]